MKIDPNTLDLKEKVVKIGRVTKVVKGGRNFRFSALVVVGDENGHVGVGTGKSIEIPEAIRKGSWTMPEVIEDVSLSVTFEKTSSTPQTGDASRPDLWFIIAALSLIGMIICWLMRKKQKV